MSQFSPYSLYRLLERKTMEKSARLSTTSGCSRRNRVSSDWAPALESMPHRICRSKRKWRTTSAVLLTERFTSGTGTVTVQNSNMKVLHGLFGPKLQTTGPVRLFVTVKGGFTNFRLDPRPASFSTFTSSIDNLRTSNVSGVLYPGAGAEAFLGPFGLRLDVGDEIIFSNGAHHNWKVTLGPVIRF
jgi:hypothetical protein